MNEDELIELRMTEGIHRDDVAMFIDECESLEDLVSELKGYFELDEKYYEERQKIKDMLKQLVD
jgi:hypothetical protein